MRRRALVGLGMAALIAIAATAESRAAVREAVQSAEGAAAFSLSGWALVGTWWVDVALANCETGEEIPGAVFPALNTFLAEGSMLSDPAANPALQRTGHGAWAYAGGRQFTNTVVLFRFNPDGSYAGTQTVRRSITVSRNWSEFTAHDTVTNADAGGTVVVTRCGIGRGRRLEPQVVTP
jgi:hypothetical protein